MAVLKMGPTGLEPVTSRTSSERSSQLSYDPVSLAYLMRDMHMQVNVASDIISYVSLKRKYFFEPALNQHLISAKPGNQSSASNPVRGLSSGHPP